MPFGDLEVDELQDAKYEAHCYWFSTSTIVLHDLVHSSHNRYVETHEIPSACNPRQNGVSALEVETHSSTAEK